MKIAITGANGFVGQHMLARLSEEPVEVVCVGRRTEGWTRFGTYLTIPFEHTPEDIFERLGRPDLLIHLAWDSLTNYRALRHFDTELPLHYEFVRRLVEGGLRRVLVTGTCFEYGMKYGALHEGMVADPVNPYGFAKNAFRQQIEYLALEHGIQSTWARLFYMWGPGQSIGSLYSLIQAAVTRGDSSFDMSLGEQLRDYLPVAEVADRLVRLALHPKASGIFNVCSGSPISVRRLAEHWIETHQWKIQLNLGCRPYPDYEPLAFWGDVSKLTNLIGDSLTT
jgi:nucleoside-diphosphate-sugar epimerase